MITLSDSTDLVTDDKNGNKYQSILIKNKKISYIRVYWI